MEVSHATLSLVSELFGFDVVQLWEYSSDASERAAATLTDAAPTVDEQYITCLCTHAKRSVVAGSTTYRVSQQACIKAVESQQGFIWNNFSGSSSGLNIRTHFALSYRVPQTAGAGVHDLLSSRWRSHVFLVGMSSKLIDYSEHVSNYMAGILHALSVSGQTGSNFNLLIRNYFNVS
jgi:hypothetical protein